MNPMGVREETVFVGGREALIAFFKERILPAKKGGPFVAEDCGKWFAIDDTLQDVEQVINAAVTGFLPMGQFFFMAPEMSKTAAQLGRVTFNLSSVRFIVQHPEAAELTQKAGLALMKRSEMTFKQVKDGAAGPAPAAAKEAVT